MDSLTIPLGAALIACGGVVTTTVGIVVWVFSNFEHKVDAERTRSRVDTLEQVIGNISSDVSYIRGRIEPRD